MINFHSNLQFFSTSFEKRQEADALVIPFWQGDKHAIACTSFFTIKELLPVELNDFKGKEGDLSLIYQKDHSEQRVILLGLGVEKQVTTEKIRRTYGILCKYALGKKFRSLNLVLPFQNKDLLRGIFEGLLCVNYAFDKYKKESISLIESINLIGATKTTLQQANKYLDIFEGVNLAKTLTNSNAEEVTPQYLGQLAKYLAKKHPSIKTTLLNKAAIEKEKMGLFLAVNQGSSREPVVIVMKYEGNPRSKNHTVVVGKGVTYDTGGLNLKPTGSMETMKADMAGASAAFGLMYAVAKIGLKVNLSIVVAATENMIGSKSYKPGDVFTSASGKTVEIDNTDAEGRLTLADAFVYANKHLAPTRMIDLSTLTGGIVIALGEEVSGLMGNNHKLLADLEEAGEITFERVWRMPLYEEYHDQLKSDIADMKNTGGRQASSITAGLFLKEFVGDTPWAHLDIAGTAYLSKDRRYLSKHATGIGVRLLFELLSKTH